MGTYKFFQAKLTFLKRKCLQRPTHSLQLQAYVSGNSYLSQNKFHAINYYTILKWHTNEFT